MKKLIAILSVTSALALPALAEVEIHEPWVRATVAPQKNTGAFMRITSLHKARLVGAQSSVAGVVEIHESLLENGVAKMRRVPALELPAEEAVELKPGSYHLMLSELKGRIREGDSVPITLTLEGEDGKRESVEVRAVARPLHHAGHGN